jgi:hypothetical protein
MYLIDSELVTEIGFDRVGFSVARCDMLKNYTRASISVRQRIILDRYRERLLLTEPVNTPIGNRKLESLRTVVREVQIN